jgi:hypothetical protein
LEKRTGFSGAAAAAVESEAITAIARRKARAVLVGCLRIGRS